MAKKDRYWSGYSEYRYGAPQKSISLPVIFKGERRQRAVSSVMDALDDWRETIFEREGEVRASVRSRLCLDGNPWLASDREALNLISEAFKRVGAARPSWEEGQKEYTDSLDSCSWCKGPLAVEGTKRRQRFCSTMCAQAAIERRDRKSHAYAGVVLRSAQRLISRSASAPRECAYCAGMFQSDAAAAQFCSVTCSARHRRGDKLLTEIDCAECGSAFRPAEASQRYCCRACGHASKKRREIVKACHCCGDHFTARTEKGVYCSKACSKIVFDVRAGNARRLSPAIFDFVMIQIGRGGCVQSRSDCLTKEIFDSWFQMAA